MTEYRYLATDAMTGNRLGELPLGDVEFSELLNQGGEISGTLDLRLHSRNGQSLAAALLNASTPRRTRLWVDRDGTLVWSGFIWGRSRPRGSTGLIQIRGRSTFSYFEKRRRTANAIYAGSDQLSIVQDLITWALAQPGGDIGVQVGTETSGVLLTRNPLAWGYERKVIAELIDELAGADNGFDFAIEPAYVDDEPVDTLRLYYPRRGRRVVDSNIVFFKAGSTGGNLIDFDLDEDGLDSATVVYGIGAGEGESMIQTVATRTDLLDAGYPLTETVLAQKSITDSQALLELTIAEVDRVADTPMRWSIEVDPDDVSVPFGSWTVGDDARIVIDDDPRFPAGVNGEPGLETDQRIIGHTVRVNDAGGPDEVSLDLGAVRG